MAVIERPKHSEKQVAIDAVNRMPDAATLQEISEELSILAAISRGEAAADEGRVLPHEEIVRRSQSWTST